MRIKSKATHLFASICIYLANAHVTLASDYTVIFDLGSEGFLINGDLIQKVPEGGAAIEPEIFVADGSAFTGWNKDFSNVTENLYVTAEYIDKSMAQVVENKVTVTTLDKLTYEFGYSLGVSGDTAVIGSTEDDENGDASGCAYVFARANSGWIQQQKLTASDGSESDYFGKSVGLSGDTIVIGAPHDDGNATDCGSAYVFVRRGDFWTEQTKLTIKEPAPFDYFGSDVSIRGNTIVVGARGRGSAYVFERKGNRWIEQSNHVFNYGLADGIIAPVAASGNITAPTLTPTTPGITTDSTEKVFILEDYDGNGVSGNDSGLFGKGKTALISKTPGNTVRKLVDDANYFGLIQIRDFRVEQDISEYDRLAFSYYSEADDKKRTIQLQPSFVNSLDPSAENLWNWQMPVTLSTGHKQWVKVSIDLKEANFKRASPRVEGNDFDLTRLNRIAVLILRNGARKAAGPVYVDNIIATKSGVAKTNFTSATPEPSAQVREKISRASVDETAIARKTEDRKTPQTVEPQISIPSALSIDTTAEVFVLEDYDGNGVDGDDGGLFGEGTTKLVSNASGNTVRELVDDASNFGLIQIRDFSAEQDVSGYDHLEFSYYSEAADKKRTIQLQLSFANPKNPSAENLWDWQMPVVLAEGYGQWKKARIDLKEANFERASPWVEGSDFDLTRLNRIAILILRNGAIEAASPVYVDNIIAFKSAKNTDVLSATSEPPVQIHEPASTESVESALSALPTQNKKAVAEIAASPTATTLILEDYEGGGVDGKDQGLFGDGTTALINETPENTVRELINGINHFGLIQIRDFSVEQNISKYEYLEFSYYSEAADKKRTIQLQLSFTNSMDPSAENLWNWKVPVSLATGHNQWAKASIALKEADFERASPWVRGNDFNLTRLNRIAILILRNGANEAAGPVYVDNIIVSKKETPTDKSTQNKVANSVAETNPATRILILEDYDGGGFDGSDNGLFGEGTTSLISKVPGNTVRQLVDTDDDFGLIQVKNLTAEQDISEYNRLMFSYYSEADDKKRTIQLQLSFVNPLDPDAKNLWNWKVPAILAAGHKKWTKANIDLEEANFERASPSVKGNDFDLTRLNRIAILILRNGSSEAARPIYIDNIAVSKTIKGDR